MMYLEFFFLRLKEQEQHAVSQSIRWDNGLPLSVTNVEGLLWIMFLLLSHSTLASIVSEFVMTSLAQNHDLGGELWRLSTRSGWRRLSYRVAL